MILDRIALSGLILSSTVAGFSTYHMVRARHTRRFLRAGLRPYRASLPNGQVHYWAGGRDHGTPLLMLHGFGGDALFGWAEQSPLAADRFVVIPDLLWFGDSHSHMEDFSLAFQAETMAQLLDHLAIERAHAVGISYGGFVAGALASDHPDRIERLAIVDSPGHIYTLDDYHHMLDRLGLDSIAEMVCPDDPVGVRRLLRLAYYRPPPVPLFVARDVFAHIFVQWKREKVRLLDGLLQLAESDISDQYHIPHETLILWGSDDELFPPTLAYELAHAIEGPAEVSILPQTNHAPNMESPRRFNALLARFLEREVA